MIHQYLIPSYYSSVSNVFSSVRVDPSKIWHKYIFDQKILIELKNHQSRLAPLSVFNVCMLECEGGRVEGAQIREFCLYHFG